jgi:hypothetical protein
MSTTATTTAKKSLKGVEIFRAGTYRGEPFTIADLDDIVTNFKRFQAPSAATRLQRAPVVVGHEEKDLVNSAVAKRGDVVELWRDGDLLKTNADDIDEGLAAAVEAGNYDDVSAEIYDRPPEGCREHGAKGKMLRRVAILGGEIPHLKGLNPAGLRAKLAAATFGEPKVRIHRIRRFDTTTRADTGYQVFSEDVAMTREEQIAKLIAAGWEAEVVNSFSDTQLAAACNFKPKGETQGAVTFSESDISKIAEQVATTIAPALNKQIAEKIAANTTELKRQRVDVFCETELRAGRIDPADMDVTQPPTLAQRLLELDDTAKVHKFTEGGTTRELTQLDAEMRAIRLRAPRYGDNGKKIASGKGGAATFAEGGATTTKEKFTAFAESEAIVAELKKTGLTSKDVVEAWELADAAGKQRLESDLGFAA